MSVEITRRESSARGVESVTTPTPMLHSPPKRLAFVSLDYKVC